MGINLYNFEFRACRHFGDRGFFLAWVDSGNWPGRNVYGVFWIARGSIEKAKRKTQELRQRLEGEVVKAATNQITGQQLEQRCSLMLEQSLPDEAYRLSSVYEPLVAQNDLGGDKYQAYLVVLERHLSKVEKKSILYSELHLKVRSLLGMPSHP